MRTRLDTLTAPEEYAAEVAAGQPITVLDDENAPKVRIFAALAWVIQRRDEPGLTFDAYFPTIRFRDAVTLVMGPADETEEAAAAEAEEAAGGDPFPAGGDGAGPGAAAGGVADAEGAVLPGDGVDA